MFLTADTNMRTKNSKSAGKF